MSGNLKKKNFSPRKEVDPSFGLQCGLGKQLEAQLKIFNTKTFNQSSSDNSDSDPADEVRRSLNEDIGYYEDFMKSLQKDNQTTKTTVSRKEKKRTSKPKDDKETMFLLNKPIKKINIVNNNPNLNTNKTQLSMINEENLNIHPKKKKDDGKSYDNNLLSVKNEESFVITDSKISNFNVLNNIVEKIIGDSDNKEVKVKQARHKSLLFSNGDFNGIKKQRPRLNSVFIPTGGLGFGKNPLKHNNSLNQPNARDSPIKKNISFKRNNCPDRTPNKNPTNKKSPCAGEAPKKREKNREKSREKDKEKDTSNIHKVGRNQSQPSNNETLLDSKNIIPVKQKKYFLCCIGVKKN